MDATGMNPTDVWNLIVENPFSSTAFILLVVSEALASIKSVQANSIFQVVVGILKKIAPATTK